MSKKKLTSKPKIKSGSVIKDSPSYKVFTVFNIIFLTILSLLCILPIIQVFATSMSSDIAIKAGKVFLIPVDSKIVNNETVYQPFKFNASAYVYLLQDRMFWTTFKNSVIRVILGTALNMFMVVVCAYPLSQDPKKFPFRKAYVWFFFFTNLFGGGLIPSYYVVDRTGLMDTLWALIIPGAVPVGNVILLLNFFRQLPKELDEAAFMDGAGHWTILFKIYLPTSLPALATITLFTLVGHWNEWFGGLLYMSTTAKYPLQTYLQTIITEQDISKLNEMGMPLEMFRGVSRENLIAAQIFIGAVPILSVYPFLQKYFAKGIVLGSVKG